MFKNFFTLTALLAISLTSFAQNEQASRQVTRTFGLAIMTDIHNEQDIQNDLQYPQMGFDLTYNKKEKGKLLEKGFSLGWQPLNTTHQYIYLPSGEAALLQATNQMVHGYITLRTTALKNHPFQPYVEGVAGLKGALLTSTLSYPTDEASEHEVHYFATTWNLGLSVGFRWEVLEKVGVDLRYARISSGDLQRVENVVYALEGSEYTILYETDNWKAPVGYLRLGISVSL
jgi:hypothetical protein